MNEQFVLRQRPVGLPSRDHLELVRSARPELTVQDELLLRTRYLSLDPYMYGRMAATQAYAAPVELGEVIVGEAVSEVLESSSGLYSPGDLVTSRAGWQRYSVAPANTVNRVPDNGLSPTTALGVLGMPGFTAYAAMTAFGRPTAGETVAVAAATGPVGSMAGQLARLAGARVIGVAGGEQKRNLLLEWGFDVALDHRSPYFSARLQAAAPEGIDVYLESVGGAVWQAVLPLLNAHARVPVIGLVSNYNGTSEPAPAGLGERIMRTVLQKRLSLQGFVVGEFPPELWQRFHAELTGWVKDGSIRYQEHLLDDFTRAPEIFVDMLRGNNLGKTIVRV
ncbi:NADP-dependent oxidoreductase [Citricoccus sp. I39-566]|uniref:NADP-dependent oxidoreductase n=1 Tax=Citricoccus sp. I39-566 TaxID=3073268 RepID=UPI00286BCC51|nr:NADP-dependent oxidoreductase [Citricoccus sp. I39-566]WMY78562.1 NADP-dependent oxidoreductase [Citricoccus sp. I39-566]